MPLDAYTQSGSAWKKVAAGGDVEVTWPASDLAAIIKRGVEAGTHLMVADVDEHMDDITRYARGTCLELLGRYSIFLL